MKTHDFKLAVCDTDSISFVKSDHSLFTDKEQEKLLTELNSYMDAGIIWAHDGIFKSITAVGAKNYILRSEDGKIKIKGSALKATKKEPRLKQFTFDVCTAIAEDRESEIPDIYNAVVEEILRLNEMSDITPWCFKVTATESVLTGGSVLNKKVFDCITKNKIPLIEGDKYYVYFKTPVISLKLNENNRNVKVKYYPLGHVDYYNDDIDKMTLLKKLYTTIKIFNKVLDVSKYVNYTLKKNFIHLDQIHKNLSKES